MFSMTKMSVEIEGTADDVVRVIQRLGGAGRHATVDDADRSIEEPAEGVGEMAPATGVQATATAVALDAAPEAWTEDLARDFLSGLQPTARRTALQVWRAGAAGIHRSALCQRAELTPAELRSLMMRMGRALGRFQRERGMTLPRPVAANSPLQSYFVDAGFAAVANSRMFSDGVPDPTGRRRGRIPDEFPLPGAWGRRLCDDCGTR